MELDNKAYHVFPQVFFLIALEAFQILEHSTAGIFDVLLGDFQCLLELQSMLVNH
jgi:hypothetical protein